MDNELDNLLENHSDFDPLVLFLTRYRRLYRRLEERRSDAQRIEGTSRFFWGRDLNDFLAQPKFCLILLVKKHSITVSEPKGSRHRSPDFPPEDRPLHREWSVCVCPLRIQS